MTVEQNTLSRGARVLFRLVRYAQSLLLLALILTAMLCCAGCSKEEKALSEIRHAYEAGEFDETVALCRYAIRKGILRADVYYYYGASLVLLDRDYEGFRRLEEAASRDPASSHTIARFLFEKGEESFAQGNRSQASRRMRQAAEIDPSLDPKRFNYLVADEYYREKDYTKAAGRYAAAIRAVPDTAAAHEAYLNMADSYAETGAATKAREALEKLLELEPKRELATQARWRLVNIMYDEGEKQFLLGNYEEAAEAIRALLRQTRNPGLVNKSRFLLGEAYEALGEFDKAYRQYRTIIEEDRGASGRIVEKAKAKVEALREAGLY